MNVSVLKLNRSRGWKVLRTLLLPPPIEQEQQEARLRFMERDIGLTIKVVTLTMLAVAILVYEWEGFRPVGPLVWQTFRLVTLIYLIINAAAGGLVLLMHLLPFSWVHRAALAMNLIDGLYLAMLVVITGGHESNLYWVFPMMILRNSLSFPKAGPQIALNLIVTASYVLAGVLNQMYAALESEVVDPDMLESRWPLLDAFAISFSGRQAETLLLRILFLLVVGACAYAIQVLFDKQRQAADETRALGSRQEQLRSTGRLAAEIAHQLKNPLSIINNAAFNVQRSLKDSQPAVAQQLAIIREEVERSDHILTNLMGYAQLSEGRVEKLVLVEELDAAITLAFPPGAGFEVEVHRNYAIGLPPFLMQRAHLKEILVNLLLNAREALNGRGRIDISALPGTRDSVVITVADTGPGIPDYQRSQIFEPYFSTKEKGTGLGLAIVKHNTELYGGTARVESELGKGARFILEFPAKTIMPLT